MGLWDSLFGTPAWRDHLRPSMSRAEQERQRKKSNEIAKKLGNCLSGCVRDGYHVNHQEGCPNADRRR